MNPVDVKLPEEQIIMFHHIIQRLMQRMGTMRVDLTDKDDPGQHEQLKISFNPRKLILTIERVPTKEIN